MPEESTLGRRPFLMLVWTAYGLLAATALLWLWLSGRSLQLGTGWASAGLGLLLGLLVAALSRILLARAVWARELALAFVHLLPRLRTRDMLVVALASGCAEELFFRGALQPAVGLLPASLIFGLLHVGPSRRFLPWTVFALAMGLALGALYEHTGDLVGPILAHVCINALNLHAIQGLPSEDVEGGAGALEL
jgi:membrane protease YdiL (CAAX protease family)